MSSQSSVVNVRDCPICDSKKHHVWYRITYEHLCKYWGREPEYLESYGFGEDDTIDIVCCEDCGMYYNRTHSNWAYRDYLKNLGKPPVRSEGREPSKYHLWGAENRLATVVMSLRMLLKKKNTIFLRDANLKVLDYSCGSGNVINYFKMLGVQDVFGYDIRNTLVDNFYGKFISDQEELMRKAPFDIIVNEASLEHYDRPMERLMHMRSLLAPNGILLLAIPFMPYYKFPRYKAADLQVEEAKGYFHERHINHFSISKFPDLMKRSRMKILPIVEGPYWLSPYINLNDRQSIIDMAKRILVECLRLVFSPVFMKRNWFPERFRHLFFTSFFVCARDDTPVQ